MHQRGVGGATSSFGKRTGDDVQQIVVFVLTAKAIGWLEIAQCMNHVGAGEVVRIGP
jgi:hypothetical protein